MDIQENRIKIISKLDISNFKDIISILSMDKMSRKIGSQKYFWLIKSTSN